MTPSCLYRTPKYYCVQRKRRFLLPANPRMTQVLRHTNTNSTHPFNMFYLRSVLLLRGSLLCLFLIPACLWQVTNTLCCCTMLGSGSINPVLLRWEFSELQFKPFSCNWPCLWLWTDLFSSHAWADPGMSHIIQGPNKQCLLRVWGQLWYMRHHTIKIQCWTNPSAPAVTHFASVITLHWVMKLVRFNL